MMRKAVPAFFLIMFICVPCTISAELQPGDTSNYLHKKIRIVWGINCKTHQVWDGVASMDTGRIVRITPFIRYGMVDDSKLITHNSWKSETYMEREGIFVDVKGLPSANIKISTVTHTFSFTIAEIDGVKKKYEMDGNIEIEDVTDQVLFQIMGFEYGQYGAGSAVVSPQVAYTDTVGTWTLTYTAGEGGIPVGGGIRISWHFSRGWGQPQFTDPTAPNYITVHTNGEVTLDYQSAHTGLFEYPFTKGRILVRVLDRPLNPGEQIIVVLGDASGGSPGFQTPSVSEDNFELRVESCTVVPEGGFPIYKRIRKLPSLNIRTRLEPARLFAVAPSVVTVDEPFTLTIIVEDEYRNTVRDYTGSVQLAEIIGGKTVRTRPYELMADDKGKLIAKDLIADQPGVLRFGINTSDGLTGESNPILVRADKKGRRLFWGELHGHTEYSDGYGTPEEYFEFARDKALLDFAAITDHDVELDAPDYQVKEMWAAVRAAVTKFYDPPNFLAIWAWEWSPNRITRTTQYPYGDHNVFYFQDKGFIFLSGDERSDSIEKLYMRLKKLPRRTRVVVIPHVGGAIANWEFHDEGLEPLAEIYSVHGSFEQFGQIALDNGYHVGFVGAADSHNGQNGGFPPGYPANHFVHGGLTGIYAGTLSQEALYEAVTERRVFATSGPRIIVDFQIDGHEMGKRISVSRPPVVHAFAVGEKPIWKVEIIKNGQTIHTAVNEFAANNTVNLLWHSLIEREDLLNFDAGFWGRRLRITHWEGVISDPDAGLELITPYSFDFPKDTVLLSTPEKIAWASDTRGDYDGLAFKVAKPNTRLRLTLTCQDHRTYAASRGFIRFSGADSNIYHYTFALDDIPETGLEYPTGPLGNITVLRGDPLTRQMEVHYTDTGLLYRENYYYIRVTQVDGEMAWSSPIWVQYRADR